MPGATTRLALPYPLLADAADGPAAFLALATALDSLALWGQGLLSARGAAIGTTGRLYYATDTGHFYVNTGTAWIDIGPTVLTTDSITANEIAANAVGSSELADNSVDAAAIQALAVTNSKIATGAVDAGTIAATLKPSGGAGAATEALRALGLAAGTALAGDITQLILTGAKGLMQTGNYGLAFPGSPSDGQEFTLVDSLTVSTFRWRFRYNAGSTSIYKWEFMGGAPVLSAVATDQAVGTPGVTFQDLATAGPSFTLPCAGDFDARYRAETYLGGNDYIGLKVGAATAADASGSGTRQDAYAASQDTAMGLYMESRVLAAAAATVLKVQYRSQGGGQFFGRELRVTPVRCI